MRHFILTEALWRPGSGQDGIILPGSDEIRIRPNRISLDDIIEYFPIDESEIPDGAPDFMRECTVLILTTGDERIVTTPIDFFDEIFSILKP